MILKQGKFGIFYGCERYPECHNTHGADNEGKPLGVAVDDETRELRRELHDELDKWFDSGSSFRDWGEKADFLNNETGKTRVAHLEKDEIKKLLKKIRGK